MLVIPTSHLSLSRAMQQPSIVLLKIDPSKKKGLEFGRSLTNESILKQDQ